jgi:ATP-dependent 26S proteasome regulatory subunit
VAETFDRGAVTAFYAPMPQQRPLLDEATESRALRTLVGIFESGRPLAYVRSAEEQRVRALLREAAATCFPAAVPLWVWSLTEGMRRDDGAAREQLGPRAALDFVATHDGPALFLFEDFHEPMREAPDVRRRLRDLYEHCFDRGKFVVICSPVKFIPEEIERSIVYVELAVPDLPELVGFLRREAAAITAAGGSLDTAEATLFQLGRALQGLTLDEARHAIRRALNRRTVLDGESISALLEEKRLLVNRTGMIEYIPPDTSIEHVGGLEIMKKWLTERRKLFQMRDSLSAEIVPKGVLVMGISGCGKSLSIKAVASCFELPLYRIDMIAIFSGRHGTPEGAFVQACRMLESMAPAVVWFDEIEAGINTQAKEGELSRIFGFFLTWMQEKTRGLFVGATANRIDLLPAEMIRKGRFDEVFFVDLPLDDERLDIFRIHLRRRGVDFSGFDFEPLKGFTKGWTGAEIEQCVVSALTTTRLEDRTLKDVDLFNATNNVVPLSKTMKEQVDHIRKWAFDRAVRASPREFRR